MTSESPVPTSDTADLCTVSILIEGTELSGQYSVVSLQVAHEVNRIPYAHLIFQDGEASRADFPASNSDLFIPGKTIDIQLGYRSQNESVFQGIIVKHSIKVKAEGSFLFVECRDSCMRMALEKKSYYFSQKKDSEIMNFLIGQYSSLTKTVEFTTPDIFNAVQVDAYDWDYLVCRAQANGFIVSAHNNHIDVQKPNTQSSPQLELRYGANLLEFEADMDARNQFTTLKAVSWNPQDQKAIEVTAAEPTITEFGNISHDDLAQVGMASHRLLASASLSNEELQHWADAQRARDMFAKIRGRTKCQGTAVVKANSTIKVSGVGERFEGTYYVSGVRHSLQAGNWETDLQLGLSHEVHAERVEPHTPLAQNLLPGILGLQIGVVTDFKDPDNQERIKVRVPLIDANSEGIWARLATFDAGKQHGACFKPEIGDEVVLGFLQGDPRHPIILGQLFSGAHTAPITTDDDNNKKGYVSRENISFIIDDKKKSITLSTPAGNKLVLSDDAGGIRFEDQHGNSCELNSDGITLNTPKEFKLVIEGDMTLKAKNIDIKAQLDATLKADKQCEVSATSLTLKASGAASLKGSLVQIN